MSKKPEKPDVRHEHPLLDFPTGTGESDCPICKGRGVIPRVVDIGGGVMFPGGGTEDCQCVFKRDLIANVQRVWKVLLNVESVEDSILLKMTKQSVWLTASGYDFRRHMRFVAFRMGPKWDARVIADATLVTAWLSGANDVFDADVLVEREGFERERPSEHFATLVDIAVPFDLLIIKLGVKAAKNREMPNVLAEAINERDQQGKPTWIVDSPVKPLGPGHICYNDAVLELLDGFRRVILSDEAHVPEGMERASTQYKAPNAKTARKAPVSPQDAGKMASTNYTRSKGTMGTPALGKPVAKFHGDDVDEDDDNTPYNTMTIEDDGKRPDVMPEMDDEDEFSVDALLADAHDPSPDPAASLLDGKDPEAEVEELLEDFPDVDELGGNADRLPAFLGTATKEERQEKERQEKRQKRWEKKHGKPRDEG